MTKIYRVSAILLGCALAGTYAYLLLAQPFASLNNQHAQYTLSSLTKTSGTLMYGTVSAIDLAQSHMDIATRNPYDGSITTLSLRVIQPAVIAYQTLQGENGVATSLSTQSGATLRDIPLGSHAAVYILRDENNALSTNYILFGDPL